MVQLSIGLLPWFVVVCNLMAAIVLLSTLLDRHPSRPSGEAAGKPVEEWLPSAIDFVPVNFAQHTRTL